MTHATALELSMLADEALPQSQATSVRAHVSGCSTCQAQFNAMRHEADQLGNAIHWQPGRLAQPQMQIPEFKRPLSLRSFALANVATGLLIWLIQFLWKTLFGELVINATNWATSIYLPDAYAVVSATALYLLEEGTAMLNAYLSLIVGTVLLLTALSVLLARRKTRDTLSLGLFLVVAGSLAVPQPGHALEYMQDEGVINIAASETINDTLIIAAETILIEGTVTGDVVAAGRSIDISGEVHGNLLTFGETVKIRGKVGGMTLGAASSYTLNAASLGGDLWFAGESINMDKASHVIQNATLATQNTTVGGSIGKDLYAFSETVELSGIVGEDLEAFADRVRLLSGADIKGNVNFRTDDEDKLYRADTAKVGGEVAYLDMPEQLSPTNRYATADFYVRQIAGLVAAFIVGMILLWLVPGLRRLSLSAGVEGLKSAGIGLLVLISTPIILVLLAITLVGIPIAVIILLVWLIGLYLAKIVVGSMIGHMLMGERSLAVILLVGLSIVAVAVNLPVIGGIVHFLLAITGLGLLTQYLYQSISGKRSAG